MRRALVFSPIALAVASVVLACTRTAAVEETGATDAAPSPPGCAAFGVCRSAAPSDGGAPSNPCAQGVATPASDCSTCCPHLCTTNADCPAASKCLYRAGRSDHGFCQVPSPSDGTVCGARVCGPGCRCITDVACNCSYPGPGEPCNGFCHDRTATGDASAVCVALQDEEGGYGPYLCRARCGNETPCQDPTARCCDVSSATRLCVPAEIVADAAACN